MPTVTARQAIFAVPFPCEKLHSCGRSVPQPLRSTVEHSPPVPTAPLLLRPGVISLEWWIDLNA